MINKIRAVAAILILSVLVSILPVSAFEASPENQIIGLDFETASFATVRASEYAVSDEEHGKSLKIKSDKTGSAIYSSYTKLDTKYKAESVQKSKIYVSFDFNIIQGGSTLIFLMRNERDSKVGAIYVDGKNQIYLSTDGTSEKIAVTSGEWHHVEAVLDMESSLMTLGCDGKLIGQLPTAAQGSTYINNLYIGTGRTADASYWVDNVEIYDYSSGTMEEFYDSLDDGRGDVAADYKNVELGGIHFENSVSFDVVFKNKKVTEQIINYDVELYSAETGKIYLDTEDKITLAPKSKETKRFFVNTDRYGFYDAVIKLYDENGAYIGEETGSLSVVHALPEGQHNDAMGIGCHTINFHLGYNEMERKMKLVSRLGVKGYREGIYWSGYEKTKGNFQINADWIRMRKYLEENGLENEGVIVGENKLYGSPQKPLLKEHIDANAEYIKHLSADLAKGAPLTYFEIGNEWNIDGLNGKLTAQDYVNVSKAAYTAAKQGNPNQIVYGLGGVTVVANMLEWIEECFSLGGYEYGDGYTIHPYEFNLKPEGCESFSLIEGTKKIMEKYGVGDRPLVVSEFGWPSHTVGESNQAKFSVRYAIMSTGMVDRIYWYNFQCKEQQSTSENSFGWIRQSNEGAAAPYGEPYAAKPVYLAMANYNALLTGAELIGRVEANNDDTYAYRFKRTDGSDLIAIWNTTGEKQSLAVDVGADNAVVYDFYGNASTIYAYDGSIRVTIDDAPIFITGTLPKADIKESDITVTSRNVSVAADDYANIMLEKSVDKDMELSLELPDNITGETEMIFSGSQTAFKLKTGAKPHKTKASTEGTITKSAQSADETVYVVVKDGGKVIAREPVYITYEGALTQRVQAEPYRSGRWQVEMFLRNIKDSSPVSGTIHFDGPKEIVKNNVNVSFENLLAGDRYRMVLNVPEDYPYQKADVAYTITLDNGELLRFNQPIYFTGISYTDKPPVIDGVINQNEWNILTPMKLGYESQSEHFASWGGKNDLSGKVYLNYDKDNFYISAVVEDNMHYSADSAKRVWVGDCIQFAFTNAIKAGATRTEYGIGLLDGEPTFERYAFMQADEGIIGVHDKQKFEGIELEVVRNGTQTVYECKIPWLQIYGVETDMSKQKEVYFSLLINDNDTGTRRGWLEYCPGIGTAKNTELFISVPLIK